MSRDKTARSRTRQYLQTNGAVDDPNGYATSVLKDAIQYEGTAVAFIQLIASMDRDGEITRTVRGKRTYRITGNAAAASATAPVPVPGGAAAAVAAEIDYDRLARAIVREFFRQAAENSVTATGTRTDRLRAERDEYALLLELARLRLGTLLGDRAGDQSAPRRHLNALSE